MVKIFVVSLVVMIGSTICLLVSD